MIKKKSTQGAPVALVIKSEKTRALAATGRTDGGETRDEQVEGLIEKARRSSNILSYEEILEFCEQHGFSETDTADLFKYFERENVELVPQDELETQGIDLEVYEDEREQPHVKAPLESLVQIRTFQQL